jgi:predicted DNA-binding antitoxin AbrB/MazE fold protein
MSQAIRAIYEGGQLRLLDPVTLAEGEQVAIMILNENDAVLAALGDLVVPPSHDFDDEDVDEAALLREIENVLEGKKPLSETIIEERREGP